MSEPCRIGIGYDIHRLVEGRKLVLGGVEIPFEKGLQGHSDADVLAHAICDALLGAAALGNIGAHFPDDDPRWAGASSLELLGRVMELIGDRGFDVVNVDTTVMAERPKLQPHIQAMRERLASTLRIDVDGVSIKAKTNEGLGSIGKGEAIAACAVALIHSKDAGRVEVTRR
jgi:2-C-methyl-D-erythritol 2,4-cyclodiphosphate synthase